MSPTGKRAKENVERREAFIASMLALDFAEECAGCSAPAAVVTGEPMARAKTFAKRFPVSGAFKPPGEKKFTGYILCAACATAQDTDPSVLDRVEAWCARVAKVVDLETARVIREIEEP